MHFLIRKLNDELNVMQEIYGKFFVCELEI